VKFTSWEGWLALDAHELALGASATEAGGSHGVEVKRERIKVVPRGDMVSISRDGVAAQV
jgi:ferredoxin/flavodoxin---NADP+ reductase